MVTNSVLAKEENDLTFHNCICDYVAIILCLFHLAVIILSMYYVVRTSIQLKLLIILIPFVSCGALNSGTFLCLL